MNDALAFLPEHSEVVVLMREYGWANSRIGPPHSWPPPLRAALALMLRMPRPAYVTWGGEQMFFYNDAFIPHLGSKHPGALGQPASEVWSDLWGILGFVHASVLAGKAQWFDDMPVVMTEGADRPRWFSSSFTPLLDDDGEIAGVFCAAVDTTERAGTLRRQAFRLQFQAQLDGLLDPKAVMDTAVAALGRHLGANRVGYSEVLADDQTIVFTSCYADGVPVISGKADLDSFGPDAISRQRSGSVEVCDDVRTDTRQVRATWAALDTLAFVSVPLVRNGRFTASLYVNFKDVHRWITDEVALVKDVATRTWAAVEQAKAEKALAASEEQLRLATEAAEIGMWDVDLTTDTLFWPARVKAMFGIDPEVPVSMADYYAGLHPGDQGPTTEAFAAACDPGRRAVYDVEYRTVGKKDGEIRWVAAKGRGVFNTEGRCVRVIGTAIDITTRKIAESRDQALVGLTDRFRDCADPASISFAAAEVLGCALGISRVGYGTVDPIKETITIERDWNAPGISSLAGTLNFRDYGSFIEDLKAGLTVVFADADKDPRTAASAHALKAIDAQAIVNIPVTERGDLVAILYLNHGSPRDWSDEELAFVREVAERTRVAVGRSGAEQELRTLAASLEAKVEERTAELIKSQEALRQSQKMEAVGQLTGGLAHDFNNLLTGISGSLDLLQKRVAQGRVNDLDRYLIAAQGAAKRAAALTHRLLAFSRRQTLDPKPTDVRKLVLGLTDLIRRTVGPEIAVETVDMVGLWPALVDPPQLENALLNLCINARDAMPDGGRITIETANRWMDDRTARERDVEPGQYLSLCVSDTGIGMSPDIVSRAFDPFFTTKPLGQGTGLGLSMIYGFTRQSGGQVRIYSEIGQGTMVCIYLPRHYGEGEDAIQEADTHDEAPRAIEGETVLVVDDEPTVRMLVTDVLGDLGYDALEAEDGASGLKILQSRARVDLLITDVGLPGGMNGRQVADAARVLRPGLKVLFITGYAENAVVGNGHLDPGMALLTKPFAMDDLAAKIRALLEA